MPTQDATLVQLLSEIGASLKILEKHFVHDGVINGSVGQACENEACGSRGEAPLTSLQKEAEKTREEELLVRISRSFYDFVLVVLLHGQRSISC